MKIIKASAPDAGRQIEALRRKLSLLEGEMTTSAGAAEPGDLLRYVEELLAVVVAEGDAGVARLTLKFDHVNIAPGKFRVSPDEIDSAARQAPRAFLDAVAKVAENVRSYQEHIMPKAPQALVRGSARLGLRITPLDRVGVLVPGASAPLPSSLVMCAVPAQVARVGEIAVASPPVENGSVRAGTLAACKVLGITEVYRVGGVQAVAALAYGTEKIPRVRKIVGPSNSYVTLAKRAVYGLVDIDSFPGPSEVLIIADDAANPDYVAADLLSQAEHFPGAGIAVVLSDGMAERISAAVERQLGGIEREGRARQCLERFSFIYVAADLDDAVGVANEMAPEHIEIHTREPAAVAERITCAGAIFVGEYTPTAVGDYVAGPSHVLPTGGTAGAFSGLSVYDFLKRTSVVRYAREDLAREAGILETMAAAEGLTAHWKSVEMRLADGRKDE